MKDSFRGAFTLVELLTVIVIIGLIAASALVTLKDSAEVKAKQYTNKVMQSVYEGVARQDVRDYFVGFVNDFGTIPPDIYFLLNIQNGQKYIGDSLQKYKFVDAINQHDGLPLPFMSCEANGSCKDEDMPSETKISTVYTGFQGGYMNIQAGDELNKSIKDGWGNAIYLEGAIDSESSFLKLISYGSDGLTSSEESYIKEEFDEHKDSSNIKSFFADDIESLYEMFRFKPRDIKFDMDINGTVVIYSPMLYYAEGSSGVASCSKKDSIEATCGVYKPYIYGATLSDNLWWHVGVVKYAFTVEDNEKISFEINGESKSWSDERFIISAGDKEIVILDNGGNFITSFSQTFLPNKIVTIKYPR